MAVDDGKKDEGGGAAVDTDAVTDALIKKLKNKNELEGLSIQQQKDLLSARTQALAVEGEMLVRMGQTSQAFEIYKQAREAHEKTLQKASEMAITAETKRLEIQKLINAGKDDEAAALQELLDAELKYIDAIDDEIDQNEKRLKLLEDATAEYGNLNDAGKKHYKQMKAQFEGVGAALIGLQQAQDTMVGKGAMFVNTLINARGAADGTKGAFKEVFNITNVAASFSQKVVESFMMMFTAMDKAAAGFAAATGTGRQYVGAIESTLQANNNLGVNLENTTQAFKGLLDEMIGFNFLSDEMQQSIAGQVAQFDRLGIKSEQAADLMNTFSSIMGATAQESVDLTRHLALMGTTVGISSQKMISNFNMAQQRIAVYGKKSIGVFTNMAAAAKAAGVEMSTLVGIASQFDTFESAADAATKLNAILGSNISATRMINMSTDEQIMTVIRQIQVSGESFAQMDKHKQRAIANAVGITDMAEANKIFGMSLSAYRDHQDAMRKSETHQKKMEEAIKATVPIQEMFANMMIEFAPQVTPLLETVRSVLQFVLDVLTKLNTMTNGTFPYFIFAAGALATVMKVLAARTAKKTAAAMADNIQSMKDIMVSGQQTAAKGTEAAATDNLTKAKTRSTKAAKSGAGAMLAFGAAALMVGTGIYLAATGLATFVEAFSTLSPDQLNAVLIALGGMAVFFIVLAAALFIVGTASTFAAGPVMAVGFAILMMGAGIGLAAAGMAMLVTAIGGLGENGAKAAAAFMVIAQGMGLIVLSAAALAIALYFAIPAIAGVSFSAGAAGLMIGIMALALGVAAVAAAFLGPALTVIAEGLVAIVENGGSGMAALAGIGAGLAAMAIGIAAMFVFISNPLGWLAIAAAMGVMAGAIGVFVYGINQIDEEKIKAISSLAASFASLTGDMEGTIVAQVTGDLENFKETMDASLTAQVASLSTFQDVRSMTSTRAETMVQNQVKMPDNLVVNAQHTIHTKIGDKEFNTAVKNSVNEASWGKFDAAPKNLVAAGNTA